MTQRGGMTRARDADREQVIATLDEAYVDGQLSSADRELRVSRALEARTLSDLDVLVRDLQGRLPVAGPTGHPGRARKALLGGVAAVVLLTALVSFGLLASVPDDEASVGTGPVERAPAVEAPPVAEEPAAEPEPVAQEPLTLPYFRAFVRDYEKEFGGTRAWDASFYEAGYVVFKRPVSRDRQDVLQDWSWYPDRGFESANAAAGQNVFDYAAADLSGINLKALVRSIGHGRRYLGVENAEMRVGVSPRFDDAVQTIEVRASNSYGDYGIATITFDGEVVASQPFVRGR